jgi:hypothetical protein
MRPPDNRDCNLPGKRTQQRFDVNCRSAARVALRGSPMHLGDSITVSLAAANHDPAANPDPQHVDIERGNIQHQSFGGGRKQESTHRHWIEESYLESWTDSRRTMHCRGIV